MKIQKDVIELKSTDFVSELFKKLKDNDIKLSRDELNIVITEFVSLIHDVVLYEEEEVKINNFAVFFLGKKAPRKLPNGEGVPPGEIMRVRLSEKFKNKQS